MHCSRRDFTRKSVVASAAGSLLLGRLCADDYYVVRQGDTLGHIALRHGTTTQALKRANQLNDDLIKVGQKLKLPTVSSSNARAGGSPAVSFYTVVQGDTLGEIALAHGVSLAELRRANGLSNDLIRVGQRLRIPQPGGGADHLGKVRARTARIDVRSQHWERIIVHHSAIKYGNAEIYGRAHLNRGMQNGLAYHFVIGNGIDSGDGEIEIGPRWEKQLLGGHVKSYRVNLNSIGICLVGNFQEQHPTRNQLEALTQLVDWLRTSATPKATKFAGHRDIRGEHTICPGKNFPLAALHARYG